MLHGQHHVSKKIYIYISSFIFSVIFWTTALAVVNAEEISSETRQAVVWVRCGEQQGSGVVVNSEKGFVLTNAHVLIDEFTRKPTDCEIGFIEKNSYKPTIFYFATWDRYIFDPKNNRDFAILKIEQPKTKNSLIAFPSISTYEFFKLGEKLTTISYPGNHEGQQVTSQGTINAVEGGMIKTDAIFESGSSGGAGVTANNGLIGLTTGILYEEISPGVERIIDYELVDIRAVITWLDTFGQNFHDRYITHLDYDAFHNPEKFIEQANLSCSLLAKTTDQSTVYCLRQNGTRSVFPNNTVFLSWFADYSAVTQVTISDLANYSLISNITMKPGSLLKIESDPKVYIVSDNAGTLRWIPNETTAKKLFGQGWAGLVKDVPITFFQNYTIGEPLP